MSNVTIHLVREEDTNEILEFEKENRAYFESMIPGRGDAYYDIDNFKEIMADILEEQEKGRRYMYIIRNEAGEMVGRVNLFSIVRSILEKAEIGYRIGEKHTGQGYATEAVRLLVDEAFTRLDLHRLEAGTSPKNIGSQVVLVKNGFQFVGRFRQFIHVHGQWEDSINFEKVRGLD